MRRNPKQKIATIRKTIREMKPISPELKTWCLRLLEDTWDEKSLRYALYDLRLNNSRGNGTKRPDLYNNGRTLISWVIRQKFGVTDELYASSRASGKLSYRLYSDGGVEYLRQSYYWFDPKSRDEWDGGVSKFRGIRSMPSLLDA